MTSRLTILGVGLCVAALGMSAAHAAEAKANFELQARIAEVASTKGGTGVATIEVFLEAFQEARSIALAVEGPDGREWALRGRVFVLDRPTWTAPGGEPLDPGVEGVSVPSKGMILTTIAVPFEIAGPREIVLRATGIADAETVVATAVVRVILAGDRQAIVEQDGLANFAIGEVK